MNALTPDSELDMHELHRQLDAVQAKIHQGLTLLNQAASELTTIRLAVTLIERVQDAPPISASPFLVPVKPVTPVISFPAPKPVTEPEPVSEEPLIENDEWKRIKNTLDHSTVPVFVTGGAGVGKTTLLHQFVEEADKNVVVVASTGVAALRAGGVTAHSFFRLPAHALDEDDVERLEGNARSRIKNLDTVVLDEASMLRADVMDAVNTSLQKNRDNQKPFGGAQIIMFGDPYQLPPVVKSEEKEVRRSFKDRYGTEIPFFFHAACWRDQMPKIETLTTVFRQRDEAFIKALNAVRDGTLNQEQLDLINQQVLPNFKPPEGELWITLTTTNAAADLANQRMLAAIQTIPKTFDAFTTGDFNLKDAPTDEFLTLKVGAAVMFIRNDSSRFKRWVNGTLGRVVSLSPLRVEVNGSAYEVTSETWEKIAYEYDAKAKKLRKVVVGSFNQIPLKLAAAITIHKSQGLSLDHAIIDLSTGTFASGQAYTALSRCRTLAGMKLLRPLRMDDLIVSSEVRKFLAGEPIARPQPSPMMLL